MKSDTFIDVIDDIDIDPGDLSHVYIRSYNPPVGHYCFWLCGVFFILWCTNLFTTRYHIVYVVCSIFPMFDDRLNNAKYFTNKLEEITYSVVYTSNIQHISIFPFQKGPSNVTRKV